MPSLETYSRLLKTRGNRMGEALKYNSDNIIEQTWDRDIASQTAYLYDWYHDNHKTQLKGFEPKADLNKIPIDIKFIQHSIQTYEKDPITFHIQLKPSQKCNVPYYEELYSDVYDAQFPIGLYIDIADSRGKYNRWLIVAKANSNQNQFPTYEVLQCDHVLRWIANGRKYEMAGPLRSQNSYNSGEWHDRVFTSVQDQQKFVVPMNRDTESLWYNLRMIVDANVLSEPRTFHISKVNRLEPKGVVRVTLNQEEFNPHTDYIEKDEDGNVIGMWADYYTKASQQEILKPSEEELEELPELENGEKPIITFAGTKPQLRVGGSYKTFTSNVNGEWQFLVDGTDVTSLLLTKTPEDSSENTIKIKWNGDDTYIGKILNLKCNAATLDVEIVSL